VTRKTDFLEPESSSITITLIGTRDGMIVGTMPIFDLVDKSGGT
jgi:hypothetical protein